MLQKIKEWQRWGNNLGKSGKKLRKGVTFKQRLRVSTNHTHICEWSTLHKGNSKRKALKLRMSLCCEQISRANVATAGWASRRIAGKAEAAEGQISWSHAGFRDIFEFCLKCEEKPWKLRAGEGYAIHILEGSFCFSELLRNSNTKRQESLQLEWY